MYIHDFTLGTKYMYYIVTVEYLNIFILKNVFFSLYCGVALAVKYARDIGTDSVACISLRKKWADTACLAYFKVIKKS